MKLERSSRKQIQINVGKSIFYELRSPTIFLKLTFHRSLQPSVMAVILKNHSFITFLFLFLLLPWQIHGFKTPFHPRDILPLLPRQVSWPILNSLYSAVDIMPTFVGVASMEGNNTLEWKGACFYKNIAWLELHNKSKSQFGGGTLHIKVSLNLFCYFSFFMWVFVYSSKYCFEKIKIKFGVGVSGKVGNLIVIEVKVQLVNLIELLRFPIQVTTCNMYFSNFLLFCCIFG